MLDESQILRLNSYATDVGSLGPGPAAVLWVQGCSVACPGCMSVETWPEGRGVVAEVVDVAAWLNSTAYRYITLSGGEPFEQAPALSQLVDALRSNREWIVTAYSGLRRRELERDVRPGTNALLRRLDVLIDGRYVEGRHTAALWRGSDNQQIHLLSSRVTLPADESVGFEVRFDDDGAFVIIGVPSVRRVRDDLEAHLGEVVVPVADPACAAAFPFPVTRYL